MSGNMKSRSKFRGKGHDQESAQLDGPVVDQKTNGELPQQEEPPAESQAITPDQGKEDDEAPVVQGEGQPWG